MPTKTELIWDEKYDERGNRVAPLRVAPMVPYLLSESGKPNDPGSLPESLLIERGIRSRTT